MRALLSGLGLMLAALAAAPAATQEPAPLAQARAAGAIGERYDGYIGVAAATSPAVRSAVAAINIKRRSLYSNLAQRRGVAAQDVGITAACTLLARVGVGEAYLLADGQWRRRGSADGPPRPDYCR